MRVKAGPADEPLRAGLTRRVAAIAAAYGDLAQAAASNDRGAYAKAAEHARAAEDALRRTLRRNLDPGAPRPLDPGAAPPARATEAEADADPGAHGDSAPTRHSGGHAVGPSRTPDPDHCYDCGDWQHATGGG